MKRLLLFLALLLPLPVLGQEIRSAPLLNGYDVTSTSYIYTAYLGQNNSPFGAPNTGRGRIKTAGSSTTVTENVAGELPFTSIAIGDLLIFVLPADVASGTKTYVSVTAKASGASITVSTAVDLTGGVSFSYYKAQRGTAATDGWIGVGQDPKKSWSWEIVSIAAASIEVIIQCKDDYLGAPLVPVYPPVSSETDECYTGSFSAAKVCKFSTVLPYGACRFGLKVTTDGGVQNVKAGYQAGK